MGDLKKEKGTINSTQNSVKNLAQNSKIDVKIEAGFSLNSQKANKSGNTIFHITEDYLSENYDFRFNEITIDIELSNKNKHEWKTLNEHALFV